MDDQELNANLSVLVNIYLDDQKEVATYSLKNNGGLSTIEEWESKAPKPDVEELRLYDISKINKHKRKKKNKNQLVNVKSLSFDDINELDASEGDLVINSDSNSLQIYIGGSWRVISLA